MKTKRIKAVVLVGVLSALAFVFYYLELSVAFIFVSAPYLKIDFSDIPAILGGIAGGPVVGVLIELVKNILHFLLISKEPMASGEIANFFVGIAYLLPLSIMLRRKKGFAPMPYIIAIILATAVAAFINYYISLPLYGITESTVKLNLVLYTLSPFNLLKGFILSVVTALLYHRLKPVITKYR